MESLGSTAGQGGRSNCSGGAARCQSKEFLLAGSNKGLSWNCSMLVLDQIYGLYVSNKSSTKCIRQEVDRPNVIRTLIHRCNDTAENIIINRATLELGTGNIPCCLLLGRQRSDRDLTMCASSWEMTTATLSLFPVEEITGS